MSMVKATDVQASGFFRPVLSMYVRQMAVEMTPTMPVPIIVSQRYRGVA